MGYVIPVFTNLTKILIQNIMTTTDTVILMNIEKICRICLIESDNMKSVFGKLDDNQLLEVNISNFPDMLTRITNLPVS